MGIPIGEVMGIPQVTIIIYYKKPPIGISMVRLWVYLWRGIAR